jgi:hypothetical protein
MPENGDGRGWTETADFPQVAAARMNGDAAGRI